MKDKIVICMDDGDYYLATRQVLDDEGAACIASGIDPSRRPRVLTVSEFLRCLPAANVKVNLAALIGVRPERMS